MKRIHKLFVGFMLLVAIGAVALMPTRDVQATLPGHWNGWTCGDSLCVSRASRTTINSIEGIVFLEARILRHNVALQAYTRQNTTSGITSINSGWRNIPQTNLTTYRTAGRSERR